MNSLNLGLIGNGSISALIDSQAEIVWSCLPRFDSNPVFCSLLREGHAEKDFGFFSVELAGLTRTEQHYQENTAILITRLYDGNEGCVEITDFAPRFRRYGRIFRPMMLVRQVKKISGSPRIRVRLRPSGDYGAERVAHTFGSNHIRYLLPDLVLRLTSDASVTSILQEIPFFLEDSVTFLLGPDETVTDSPEQIGKRFLEDTQDYWWEWVRILAIPFEWQEAVIRAAITLKLNTYDETGAIIAAVTTSIPESAGSERNWDYRYCWLRDGYFVVNALNRLGATKTMENYLSYIINIAAGVGGKHLQPVYAIDGRAELTEISVPDLPGYRGMGPVRRGNLAYEQIQHDVYGSAILAATHVFFDQRLNRRGDEALFRHLELLGEQAIKCYAQPDAGLWELRGTARVHTFSAVMCWAGCDRLSRIATRLGLLEQAERWRSASTEIHKHILAHIWNEKKNSFASTFGGEELDASLLLLAEVGFIEASDPRFIGTVEAIERELKRGDYIFRYIEKDDFGEPENAFLVCSFWYVDALVSLGRKAEARVLFEKLLACRNHHGLLAEHINVASGEQWGNYVQTYSMVGLINSAARLSIRWDQAF
ncbi:MAG TPA: glycoside hydrolase family 15 protein [Rhodocyclaceae bacterium]|nr:glycoside hydrolase family 15 protein [Rhodocyclaceae bacterium]